MGLVELYGTTSPVIFYGDEDEFAARLLRDALQSNFRTIKLIKASAGKIRGDPLVIYLGAFSSNPLAAQAFKNTGYTLKWDQLPEGSYMLMTSRKGGSTTIFVSGKDRIGTLYAAQDLKNYYLHFEPGRVLLNELNLVERPQLKYRWVQYNLRHVPVTARSVGVAEVGSGPSAETPAVKDIEDVKGLVNKLSAARVNGLLISGLPEMAGGDTSAVAEFCRYSDEKGVRILPIVTVGGGEGLVGLAGHSYNLISRAQMHPELRAIGANGTALDQTLCPSRPENQEWYREGTKWWQKDLKAGGLHLDAHYSAVCYCPDCRKARAQMSGRGPDSFKELARIVRLVGTAVQDTASSFWVSYAMGIGFDPSTLQQPLTPQVFSGRNIAVLLPRETAFPTDFAQWFPEDPLAVWDLRRMVKQQSWPSPFKAPARHNVGQLGWGNRESEDRHQLYFKRIQEIARQAKSSNLEGLMMPLNEPASLSNVEISLLAFGEFAFDPAADTSSFLKSKLSFPYGSPGGAGILSKILDLLENEDGMLPQNKTEALSMARQAFAGSTGIVQEHWHGLIEFLEDWKTP